jgi:dipeptidyl aminopeptidase/acylaminoacyl peptidase
MLFKKITILLFALLLCNNIFAQNGKIVERKEIKLTGQKEIQSFIYKKENGHEVLKKEYEYLNLVRCEKIMYMSDGLKVVGFLLYPKEEGKYPGIIYNRGGNKEFGKITLKKAGAILARIASWGYVVVASQYRGNDGGEGHEEFGGADVDDVLNLIPLLKNNKMVIPEKLGIYGWSRGGMMTYLTLMETNEFKAACVGGGLSDLYLMMSSRNDNFETVYEEVIPNYEADKKKALDSRSAIKNVDKISKTTPVLMLHGSADWRVVPQMALDMANKFLEYKIPYRLIIFEGGDHGLYDHRKEVDRQVKMWLDRYVKNGEDLPELSPHGK